MLVLTGDVFASSHPAAVPHIVKLDIEGLEADALAGMASIMRRHAPIVVCETHGRNEAVADVFDEHGYVVDVLEGFSSLRVAPSRVNLVARPHRGRAVG